MSQGGTSVSAGMNVCVSNREERVLWQGGITYVCAAGGGECV